MRQLMSPALRGPGLLLCLGLLAEAVPGAQLVAAERYAMSGMVLRVDREGSAFVVSHDAVPGVMPAMTMPFEVRDVREIEGLGPGTMVSFALVVDGQDTHAENVRVVTYETAEQDPLTASRLRLLTDLARPPTSPRAIAAGQQVPDFTLTDQAFARVRLSSLRGRTVAVNFIYTSCALPQFCFRVANHFGVVQRRFRERLGKDLVLLTITFDPARDSPEVLARYARQWQASPETWHFLTGSVDEVRAVGDLFGVDAFPDEGLMNHSVRTAIIDRHGTLLANIEGNRYTATQVGDLVATVMDR
jgi:protein SCO1/2